jgi:hypothetical protein
VDRVIRIQELFAAGLHSGKIAQLLPCIRDADGGPSEIADAQLVDALTAERDRIDQLMAELRNSRDILDEVITAASDRYPPLGTGQPVAEHAGNRPGLLQCG